MKTNKRTPLILLFSLFALCSCNEKDTEWGRGGSHGTDPNQPGDLEVPIDYEQLIEAAALPAQTRDALVLRAEEMSQALRTDTYRSGVYLYGSSRVYTSPNNAAQLAARLKLLGVTDVYNYVEPPALLGTNANQNTWFKEFNALAHHYGLRVWALSFMEPTDYTNTGTYPELASRVNAVKTFNNAVEENQQFDGYSLDYEPHILTANLSNWPTGLPKTAEYTWVYTGGQGLNGPNNRLLGITLDMCATVRSMVGNDALIHEAISYIFQRDYDQNLYDKGSAVQFLEPCNNLVVMAYEKTAGLIWSTSQRILNNAKTKSGTEKSVSLCIKTDVNSEGTDYINPRKWDNMIDIITQLNGPQMGETQSSYGGVDFFSYSGLQQIWFDFEP